MILVTGGTGLIGTHLLFELAAAGQKVRALKRPTSNLDTVRSVFEHYSPDSDSIWSSIEWVDGDINDLASLEDAIEGIDQVYHSAAIVSFDNKQHKKLMKINVEGTSNVMNCCIDAGVQKICYVSSTSAIGKHKQSTIHSEDEAWNREVDDSAYAISKFLAEREAWRAAEEGPEVVIVNPAMVIGPGDWSRSSMTLFKSVAEGLKYYTTGENAFVDARDVARIMVRLMEGEINKERYLVLAENRSFQSLFKSIAESLDTSPPNTRVRPWMAEIAWRAARIKSWFTGKPPLITKSSARNSLKKVHYSNKKVKKALNYDFYSIDSAIQNAARYYKTMKDE